MKRTLTAALLLMALGGTTLMAQDRDDWGWRGRRNDVRQDYRERHNDRRDINRDRYQMAQDRAELQRDYAVGNYYAANRERSEMRGRAHDMRRDYRDVKHDRRDIRNDRNWRRDRDGRWDHDRGRDWR